MIVYVDLAVLDFGTQNQHISIMAADLSQLQDQIFETVSHNSSDMHLLSQIVNLC